MKNTQKGFQFNFGPISRTLGERGEYDYLGFASLPVHQIITALLGARERDEFISWLWHDTFKALFIWGLNRDEKPGWFHIPAGAYRNALGIQFDRFAGRMNVDSRMARFHHHRSSTMLKESVVITNEFGALHFGKEAQFIQLSFACQPAAHTMPLRYAIIEAFLRAVNQFVADAIARLGLKFKQVKYVFKAQSDEALSAEQIAQQYDLEIVNGALQIIHYVPSGKFINAHLTIDLTDASPKRGALNTLSLVELLTVYRDDLTVITALPLFCGDFEPAVDAIRTKVYEILPHILLQMEIDPQSRKAKEDLLQVLVDMMEIRAIDEGENEEYKAMWQGKERKSIAKPVHKLIQRPYQLMADGTRTQVCMVCGSPVTQKIANSYRGSPRLQNIFSSNFTSFEYVGFNGVVCPLCLIYASNSTKRLRGAQAILAPSTAVGSPVGSTLIEQPRFDSAGRFDPAQPLPKTVVTLQEMVLLTLISRRIVDRIIPFEVVKDNNKLVSEIQMVKQTKKGITTTPVGVHLPYAGAYLIYHQTAVRSLYQDVLIGQEHTTSPLLWQSVKLRAYPFHLEIAPAFTLLISMRDSASNFHARHTLLKSQPTQIFLSPTANFNVLVDDAVQETVDKELVETIHLLKQLIDMRGLNQTERKEFVKALLAGHNLVEAVYLAISARKGEIFRFNQAELFWNREEVAAAETAGEQWEKFTQLSERVQALAQAHPTLLSLI